ncbi:HipA domain-containing protein [Legionella nagasakiensis]|uniref:HipA domain-containing protein n=1 Tax=Legionella nagasakiensis TaxID=535290 RepID=UPI0010554A30|nr:HipA domain-containing protein [Legionella nagasakiensis]
MLGIVNKMQCLKCLKEIESSTAEHYGLHPECFQEWFNVAKTEKFTGLQRRHSSSLENPNSHSKQNNSFFHGKFKKYSASLAGFSYILKMRQDDAPELPEVEYLCNQIGKELNIPVAEFYYINFYGDKTFVTKNFIKQDSPIDLQHIYHFRPDEDHSCEGLINAISKETGRPLDTRIFINTLLFDSLIGNHDRHGRNLAFIVTSSSTKLSPIYDNVSYLSLETGPMLQADFNPTGRINTKDSFEPSMVDYVREFKRLGYQAEIDNFYKRLSISKINQLINDSFCSDLMKQAIKRLIEKRFEELENAR